MKKGNPKSDPIYLFFNENNDGSSQEKKICSS